MKICVVTGTRAEYGILRGILRAIDAHPKHSLLLFVTGMHLSPEFGLTYHEIEADGFTIDEKIEMLLSSDTACGTAKSMGIATISFADAYARHCPDLLMILGDRFELLAAVQAALVAKIPVAHISGGDTTEGAFDEAIRHSITKMSHLHFTTNRVASRRVRQLGENPQYIFEVGNPALDEILALPVMSRAQFEAEINMQLRPRNVLVTYHPVTLSATASTESLNEVLMALDALGPDVGIIFTLPNADPEGRQFIKMINHFAANHSNCKVFSSLGQLRYFNAIRHVDVVVGNSSSGLLEVPSFKKPTVNIGDRQKGRLQASSIIQVDSDAQQITMAIQKAFTMDCRNAINPYGDGQSVKRILAVLDTITEPKQLLRKHFFDLPV